MTIMQFSRVLGCLLVMLSLCEGARILLVSLPMGSHMHILHTIGRELMSHGHTVTTMIPSDHKLAKSLPKEGFKVFEYYKSPDIMAEAAFSRKLFDIAMEGEGTTPDWVSEVVLDLCELMVNDTKFNKNPALKADIAIIDHLPFVPCTYLVPHLLDIPFVTVTTLLDEQTSRVPNLPSFAPAEMGLHFTTDVMTFTDRVVNSFYYLMYSLMPYTGLLPALADASLIQKYSENKEPLHWWDLTRKTLLILHTRGGLLTTPKLSFPNEVNIEALTAAPAKPLPAHLASFIDHHEHGIIIVSFGSAVEYMQTEMVHKLFTVFKSRKERFLLKLTPRDFGMPVPDNVKLLSWMPQNDLLGHPKTKLFITHAGNNGLYEALYHGVPIIACPLFGDQPQNAFYVEAHEYGLQLLLREFTVGELQEKLTKVLDDPKYRTNTQRASAILHSAPMTPAQRAAHWIEHVLQFGVHHLRSHAQDMPWWQLLMLDLFAVYIGISLVFLFTVITFIRLLLWIMCPNNKHSKLKKA